MYEEYHISGIKQSYHTSGKTKTVVLPILMTAIVASMVIFYVKGKPEEVVEMEPAIASTPPLVEMKEETSGNISPEPIPEVTIPVIEEVDPALEKATGVEAEAPVTVLPKTAEAPAEPKKDEQHKGFTPWMEPLALDTYIRAKSDGSGRTFWENGHWITAVEGRWRNGSREFRISYDEIPEIEIWQWRYKVNQSQADFAASVSQMVNQGYTLVQTQTFRQPDGDHRYQGVWHRQLSQPTVVENTPVQNAIHGPPAPVQQQDIAPSSRAATPSATEPRGLNVNQLNFQ